ncbi:MAG: AAA family ATPase, partial [Thermoplasmata archaeon]
MAEGRRRLAAIMFTDMVGFSALAQQDERLALRTVEEYQRLLRPIFERHHGREVKALGDGFMVDFDSALDATECAIAIQRRLFERNQASGTAVVELRVGIHLGDVVQREGDIYGDAVNVASRIEPLAEASGICITGPVLEQVGNKIPYPCVQLDYGFLKNISTPITVYSIDLPWHAPPAARLTPMTDRTSELGTLQGALREAGRGHGGLVAISGESGIGKTRVAEETIRRAETTGFRVLRGRRFEEELNAPYSHWVQAARAFVRDAPPPLIYKVCDQCLREAVGLVPELADRVGPLPPAAELEPAQSRLRFFEGVSHFFLNVAKEQPLVLLLDDFQWADADSVSLLEHFATQLEMQPILVLVTFRDTEVEATAALAKTLFNLRRQHFLREVSLKRFDAENSRDLVGAVLGGTPPPKEIFQPVLERTGGNPLFVEEICRSLVEDRSLVRTTEGWQAKSNAKIAIPSTVKEVIRRRVDWIGPEAENVLAIASVFGNQFEFDLLQQLSEMKPDTLLLLVEAMLRARLLREGELGPGRSLYQFSDEQTRDVLYDGLSLVRRQRYHLKAGEALERALGHKTPERAGELAYHFLQGDDARRAIRYYVQAGDRARDMYAQREAAAGYESALRLIEQVVAPERGASAERQQGTVVAELLGDAYHYVGQHDEMLAAYRRGLELAKGCDSITLGHLWLIVAVAHSQRHEYDATLQCLDEGERALGPPPADSLSEMRPDGVAPEISLQFTPGGEGMAVRGSPSDTDRWWTEWTWVQSERMSVYYWRDEPDRMAEIIARFRPILERSARPADRAHLFGSLMLYDWRRNHGISDEGLEYARLALAAREETRDRKAIAWAKFTRGFAFFWHGDPELARPFLLTALGEGEQTEDSALVSRASTYLMVSARRAQDRAEAERLIPRVLQAAATAGHPEYEAMAHATQSWVSWRTGDLERAVESGQRALKIWREIPNRYPCDWMAIWPLTSIALDRQEIPRAVELVRDLLPPSQNPLPPELDKLVRAAIASEEEGQTDAAGSTLRRALEVAR